MCWPQAKGLVITYVVVVVVVVVSSSNAPTDIKETLVKEDLRTIFCSIKQSSFNLINSEKGSALLLY